MALGDREVLEKLNQVLAETAKDEKHIGYHIVPERMKKYVRASGAEVKHVFYEPERLEYMRKYIEFRDKTILDIGCNVGYFLFSFLDDDAKRVCGYEGKVSCANFLNKAIELFDEKDRFIFKHEYFEFDSFKEKYDVTLLLNVLHHCGDDYHSGVRSIENARKVIIDQLNKLSEVTDYLVLQLGFNWKGNIDKCLFDNGTKKEMIDFITEGTKENWDITSIGVPVKNGDVIYYEDLSSSNIHRVDSLGEFLNRPLFIMKSKQVEA